MKHKISILFIIFFGILVQTNAQNSGQQQKDDKNREKRRIAVQFFQNRDYVKATELFEDLFKEKPSQSNYIYLYNCLIGMGDHKRAVKIVKKQIKSFPSDPRYQIDLGYVYMSAEQESKGRKQYKKILDEMPANLHVIKNTASAFRARGENQYALKSYHRGRDILKNPSAFSMEIGQIHGMAGDYEAMFDNFLVELEHDDRYLNTIKRYIERAFKDDDDGKRKKIFKARLLKKLQKNSDNRNFSDLMIWYSIQEKDFELALDQAKAMDKRYDEDGSAIYSLAQICMTNNNYEIAIDALEYLVDKGKNSMLYYPANNQLLITKYLQLSGKSSEVEKWTELETSFLETLTELGFNIRTFELIRYLGQLQAYQLQNYTAAIKTLEKGLEIKNLKKNQKAQLKVELGDINLYSGDKWEAIILYAQVHKELKNDPIGHEAKFRHAKVSFYIGEFEWAKAQLDVLKAATSKLIANDAIELSLTIQNNLDLDTLNTALKIYARADMAMFMNKYDHALMTLDTLEQLQSYHQLKDDAVYLKAKTYLKRKDYHKADSLFQVVHTQYQYEILADNALYERAQIHDEIFENKSDAMELYSQLMLEHPGSIFADESRKRYRELKRAIEEETKFIESL